MALSISSPVAKCFAQGRITGRANGNGTYAQGPWNPIRSAEGEDSGGQLRICTVDFSLIELLKKCLCPLASSGVISSILTQEFASATIVLNHVE